MNSLILEILPTIESTARKIARTADHQNDLIQYTVLECYKYESVVTRLHNEERLNTWIYTTIRREYIKMKKKEPVNHIKECPDESYIDLLEEFKPYLSHVEKLWIRAYIECDGKYIEIQRKKKIHQETASERIKFIIDKCKRLKSTLF